MRHPLHPFLRIGRTNAERHALLGDLEETYRVRIRPSRSWIAAQGWYLGQVLAAAACGARDSVGIPRLRSGVSGDVRYALRRWRRRPGFAIATILTLSLGIAAATATFSLVDAVLLRPLPWKDPDSLVYVHGVYPDRRSNPATAPTWNRGTLSYPAFDALKTTAAFETVAAWRLSARLDMTFGEQRDDIVRTADVSSNFLPMLGVGLTVGRYFSEHEDEENSDGIILTWETWQRRFGARPNVIGEVVRLGSASAGGTYPKRIVGVLEPRFRFDGEPPEMLLPVGISAEANRRYSSGSLRVVARLAAGVSREQAEAEAAGLVGGTRTTEPLSARVTSIADEQLGAARRPLWLVFGGAGLLLLIACANVAGILLGEAKARSHEMAVRAALGSGRARLVRQIVVEHAIMAVLGTALGVCAAYWMIGAMVATAPEGVPRINTVRLEMRAAAFAAASGLVTLVLFGVGPAISLARTPVAATLAEGGREGLASRALGQRAVVIAQLAFALVLLTAAGLFAETMRRLTAQPLGFDPQHMAVLTTTYTGRRFGDPARVKEARLSGKDFAKMMDRFATETSNALDAQVIERVSAIPGVTAVAVASAAPFIAAPFDVPIILEGRPAIERRDVQRHAVSDRYFSALRIRLLSGRSFDRALDLPGDGGAAVVSREFERRFFPSGAVNGRFRHVYGANFERSIPYHVVGVVDDVKRREFDEEESPVFYSFDRQGSGFSPVYYCVRATGDVSSILPDVRRAITQVTPQLVVTSASLLEARVTRSIAEERFRAMLSGAFGLTALTLAAVGLYGVIVRRTADRRREFGVRVALGARPADVGGLVLRDAALMIASGLALGLPAAYGTAQLTRSLLFGISASSPFVFVLTAATLAVVAVAASFVPARRASLVDPVSALRS